VEVLVAGALVQQEVITRHWPELGFVVVLIEGTGNPKSFKKFS
jgi:hypothetical protein